MQRRPTAARGRATCEAPEHFDPGLSEDPVDAGSSNAQLLRHGGCPHSLAHQLRDLGRVDGSWAALVDAALLGSSDPFHLALAPQVRLELREHAEHVEEGFARGRAGVDRLLGSLEVSALLTQLAKFRTPPQAVVRRLKE